MEFAVPIIKILQEQTLEPAVLNLIAASIDRVCQTLRLSDPADPLRESVAVKVIQIALQGESDPDEIYDQTLNYVISDDFFDGSRVQQGEASEL
jgi:hypothetical protein